MMFLIYFKDKSIKKYLLKISAFISNLRINNITSTKLADILDQLEEKWIN